MNKENRNALKGFRPPLTFVDLMGLLVALLREPGTRNEGINIDELDAMKKAEQADGLRIKGMEGQYLAAYGAFLRDEEMRWSRYFEVLATLRARYKKNPVMLRRLDALKRNTHPQSGGPKKGKKDNTGKENGSTGDNSGKAEPPTGGNAGETKPPMK